MTDKIHVKCLHLSSSRLSSFFHCGEEEQKSFASKDSIKRIWEKDSPEACSEGSKWMLSQASDGILEFSLSRNMNPLPIWSSLPPDLLEEVLRYVDHSTLLVVSKVCRSWEDIVCTTTSEMSFSWCRDSITPILISVAPKFRNVEVMSLHRCPQLSDVAVQSVADSCRKLKAIDLSMASQITDSSLEALSHCCKNLQILDLSGCLGVCESGILALTAGCPKLRHLSLCGCTKAVTDVSLKAVASGCRSLYSLNIGWCEFVTDDGVVALTESCAELAAIDLCGCKLISDTSVVAIAENCSGLIALGLHCCSKVTDTSMYALAAMQTTGFPNTSQSKSHDVVPPSLQGFLSKDMRRVSVLSEMLSKGLETSYIKNLHDSSTSGIKTLNISGCTSLGASAVQAVCDAHLGLHTCSRKCTLNVGGCLRLTSVRCQCVINAVPIMPSDEPQTMLNPRNRPL